MKLTLIRHGKTIGNEQRLYYGRMDLPLTEGGMRELQALRGVHPKAERYYTSGMLRTEQSLRILYGDVPHEAVPELPMGKQIQVDFGEMNLKNASGGYTKVYCAAFLLSHSRYKYAELQSRPYTAPDLVRACYHCFSYFGGMPTEMVFDQDSIVCCKLQ